MTASKTIQPTCYMVATYQSPSILFTHTTKTFLQAKVVVGKMGVFDTNPLKNKISTRMSKVQKGNMCIPVVRT
jgi:hypothetical protein